VKVTLKLTKKKPNAVVGVDKETGEVIGGYEYLYTDTGMVSRWTFAIRLLVVEGNTLEKEITVNIEKVVDNEKNSKSGKNNS